jgi:hypothetical protein
LAVAAAGAYAISLGAPSASAATFGMQLAEDDVPGDKSLIEQSGQTEAAPNDDPTAPAHAPKYPIRFKTIDYQDGGDTGKLKLAGSAPPETPVYIYFDDSPFVKVLADKDGIWSTEQAVKLDDARHMLRAEQYDATTRMVSGRATVTLERDPTAKAPVPPTESPPAAAQ